MKIETIMSKNIIIGNVTNTLTEIGKIMKKYDIGFLPICDQKKIVGVITDRDIVINALSNNSNTSDIIDKYIVKNIITINQDESVVNAIKLMGEKKVRRIIVTQENKITGIISLADILGANISEKLVLETLKKLFEINRNDDLFKPEIDEFYL